MARGSEIAKVLLIPIIEKIDRAGDADNSPHDGLLIENPPIFRGVELEVLFDERAACPADGMLQRFFSNRAEEMRVGCEVGKQGLERSEDRRSRIEPKDVGELFKRLFDRSGFPCEEPQVLEEIGGELLVDSNFLDLVEPFDLFLSQTEVEDGNLFDVLEVGHVETADEVEEAMEVGGIGRSTIVLGGSVEKGK